MDGVKLIADTTDSCKACDRQAFWKDRSIFAREYGPFRNENLGGSRIRSRVRISATERARVP